MDVLKNINYTFSKKKEKAEHSGLLTHELVEIMAKRQKLLQGIECRGGP